ncbi:MAG: glucosamine-6-phosphate deaminase [Chloroflexota bacterium]
MKRPHVIVEGDYAAMSRRAATLLDAAVREHPRIVLALPTGATPVGTYAALVDLHRHTGTDWSQATTFNLDEYAGVAPDHPESYAAFMQAHLFSGVNLSSDRRRLPDGLATDPDEEAARYEAAIDVAGGIDLAVLGIGTNGHIGFNEPGDALTGPTHVAELADVTWRRNFPHLAEAAGADPVAGQRFRRAYTMGLGTILQARRILLLASGAEKRAILGQAIHGPITPRNPASFLQLHRDVTLLLDAAAVGET